VLGLGVALLVGGRACDWALPRVLEHAVNRPLLGDPRRAVRRARRHGAAAALRRAGLPRDRRRHGALQYLTTAVLAKLGQVTTIDVRRAVFRHVLRRRCRGSTRSRSASS
jgi:hypothetical protein